jgi:uncharacterized membrane protein
VRESLLFLHFIGLALGLGTGFAMLTLGLAARDMAPTDRSAFFLKAFALRRNGSIGLGLLILSGLGLLFLHGPAATFAAGGGYFHAKLALVAVVIGLFGYSQALVKKARQEGGGAHLARLSAAGRYSLITTVAVVALAVMAFH